jgi:hypothetical protein
MLPYSRYVYRAHAHFGLLRAPNPSPFATLKLAQRTNTAIATTTASMPAALSEALPATTATPEEEEEFPVLALDMGMAPGHRPYRRLWREGGPLPGTLPNLHRLQRHEYRVDRGRQKAKLHAPASSTSDPIYRPKFVFFVAVFSIFSRPPARILMWSGDTGFGGSRRDRAY